MKNGRKFVDDDHDGKPDKKKSNKKIVDLDHDGKPDKPDRKKSAK